MNREERENVFMLERRLAHIVKRASSDGARHYDRAEARALRWALQIISETKAVAVQLPAASMEQG